jgi:TPR repeat protein
MSVSHLQLALQSRKSGQFPEALSHLVTACNTNDPLALFYMADAYEYGGFGLERNFQKAFIYARRAHKAGCKYGTYMYGKKIRDDDLKDQG